MGGKIKGLIVGLVFRIIAFLTFKQISPLLSVCPIYEQDGKILLIDRADGLGFNIPGGMVRYNETLEQGALRETREETGYTIIIQGLVGIYSALKRDSRFRVVAVAYKGAVVSGTVHCSSEGKVCWLEPREVSGYMAFDGEDILKDYLNGRQSFS